MNFLLKKYADPIGMAASGLCLFHCFLMPFLLAFWVKNDSCTPDKGCCSNGGFDWDYLFLAFSAAAIYLASKHCQKAFVRHLMWACFALMCLGVLLRPLAENVHFLTYPAALGLIAAHFINWRNCPQCHPND